MKPYLFIITLAVVLMSCSTKELKEEIIQTYPDGSSKIIRMYYQNGNTKEYTSECHYYNNGQKEKEGLLKNNKKSGEWKSWYQDGTLWSIGSFVDGKSEGNFKVYTKDGKLYIDEFFKNGKPDGIWLFYGNEGEVIKEVRYKAGKLVSDKDNPENAPFK
ncbi:MAG: hypothetical protein C0594_00850 [Marinilabiliales bacterium]|nr:MAG: hypothetical protein C0594_00850 [Marinilabiliales bacterium]